MTQSQHLQPQHFHSARCKPSAQALATTCAIEPQSSKLARPLQRWMMATTAAFGLMSSTVAAPAAAVTLQEATLAPAAHPALSLNLGDLIINAIRYIQVSNISDEQEVRIGSQINELLLEQQYQPYENPQVNQYVQQVGERLVAQSDRRDIPYTFQVVESDQINAFAIPGGYIYVTTGLLRAADNEAQLAAVLAHEIAHVNERHSVEQLKRQVLAQGIADTAGIDSNTLAQIGYQLAVQLPNTREFEYEADEVGLAILRASGYAPIAAINFFENLMEQGGTPEFLRTHPTTDNRIEALREQIDSETASSGAGLSSANYQSQIAPLI